MMSSGLALSMTVLPLLAAAVLGEDENYEAVQILFATSSGAGTILAFVMMWTEKKKRDKDEVDSDESTTESEMTKDSNTGSS